MFSMSIVTIGFSALSSNRHCWVALHMAGIPGLKYSMATAQHMGREEGCSPAALNAITVFSLWVTILALHFPRRCLLHGTLCQCYIFLLLLVVRYTGIGLLSLLQVSLGKPLAEAVVTTQAVGSGWGSRLLVGVKERE